MKRRRLDGAHLMPFPAGALPLRQIGACTRARAPLQIPLPRRPSLSVVGQNLFDPAHAEFAGAGAIVIPTLVTRSAAITLVWRPRP
jgi:hypothetical protein